MKEKRGNGEMERGEEQGEWGKGKDRWERVEGEGESGKWQEELLVTRFQFLLPVFELSLSAWIHTGSALSAHI